MLARDGAGRLLLLCPWRRQSGLSADNLAEYGGETEERRSWDVSMSGEVDRNAVAEIEGRVIDGLACCLVELVEGPV
jgi:hypothetical protein